MSYLQAFMDLGAAVVLPVFVLVFALAMGAGFQKAFKSGITVGVGFIGINLVIGLLTDNLGPAAQTMVENFNLSLNIIDVGWPAASAIAFGSTLGSLAIPVGLLINVILLVIGLTKTLTVDLWNYWHIAFTGSLVFTVTGNFVLGLVTMAVHGILLLFLADLSSDKLNEFYGYPNITFPHGTSAPGYLFALPMNWVFDRIPGFKNLKADPESIQKKFGIFGDSAVMGLIIGIVIGLLAKYEFGDVLMLGMNMAGVMMLLPRMVALLMEGLAPLQEAANAFVKKRFPDRELFIGMDSALAVGHPAVLATSLLMVPITILLAVIVPGNGVLPFGDLATVPFIIALMVPVFAGNIVRAVVAASIYMVGVLLLATRFASLVTTTAINAGFDLGGNAMISSLTDTGIWTTFAFVEGSSFGSVIAWVVIIGIGLLSVLGLYRINKKKEVGEING